MTSTRIETVMTYKQWKRKFFKEVLQWGFLAFAVALFFVAMFYYWIAYGYVF